VVHEPPVATVITPERLTVFPSHIVWPLPASAVGAGVMVRANEALTALQFPFPVVVRVKVAAPLEISLEPGVYVVLRLFASAKLPSPEVLQVPPVAFVTEPESVVLALLAHLV
jgi:hypothetical protein